jgi:hypothetical protein
LIKDTRIKLSHFEESKNRGLIADTCTFGLAFYLVHLPSGSCGAKRDVTVFNDAAAFLAAEGAMDFKEGIDLAIQSIDSKKSPPYLRKSG